MAKRDPERTRKIRIAVRYLLDHNCLNKGNQSRLAEHFHVSRQRVHQIVVEERRRDAELATGEASVALRRVSASVGQHPVPFRSA
jgi:hypothetical protein